MMLQSVSSPRYAFWPATAAVMVSVLALVAPCRLVAASPSPDADPLAGNPKLDQNVKIVAEGVPIRDLLALVSQKTGVSLSAREDVADEKVIIFGPPRSLKAIMGDLAALFNDHWTRDKRKDDKDEYTLLRGNAEHDYENRLVNAGIERMLAELDEQVKALDETPEQLAKRPEKDWTRIALTSRNLNDRLATQIYACLSKRQREQVFAQDYLDISFSSLTPQQQDTMRQAFRAITKAEREAAEQDRTLGFLDTPVTKLQDVENGVLRFVVHHLDSNSNVQIEIGRTFLTVRMMESQFRWLFPVRGNPYTVSKKVVPASSLTFSARVMLKDDWTEQLKEVAEKSGAPILADFYRVPAMTRPRDDAKPDAPASDAAGQLDALCRPRGYLWWQSGKTLLLRKRDWYAQQRYEVPDRWINGVAKRLRAQKNVATYADLARLLDLTPQQIRGLNRLVSERELFPDKPLLRDLLAVVKASPLVSTPITDGQTPEKRKQNTLLFREMTAPQRAALVSFLDAERPFPRSPAEIETFRVRVWLEAEFDPVKLHTKPVATDYRYLTFALQYFAQNDSTLSGLMAFLPLNLPNDRHDKTIVAVVP